MLRPESRSLRHLIALIDSLAPHVVQPLMSDVERSAAEAFDTWGRENMGPQKHRWFQESARESGTRMWRHWSLREGEG